MKLPYPFPRSVPPTEAEIALVRVLARQAAQEWVAGTLDENLDNPAESTGSQDVVDTGSQDVVECKTCEALDARKTRP